MLKEVKLSLFRKISFLVLAIFLLILCTDKTFASKSEKGKKESINIIIWHTLSSYNKEVFTKIADDYTKVAPDIKVKPVFYSSNKDITLNLIKGDNLPDIAIISTQYIRKLVNKKILLNISNLVSQKLYKDISESFWAPVKIDNKIYGIPYLYDPFTIYVNQNLLWNSGLRDYVEPTSWKQIIAYAERVKFLNNKKWGLFVPLNNIEEFCTFVESFSGVRVLKNNKIIVNSEGAVTSLQFLQSAVYNSKIMPSKTTLNEVQNTFLSGNLAIMIANSSSLVYLTSNLPYNLDLWKIPARGNIKPYLKTNSLVIVKNKNNHYEESYKFILYLLNKENSIRWFTHTGIPPLRDSIKSSLELLIFYENNPNYSIPMLELNRDRVFPEIKNYDEINAIIKNAVEKIMIKGEDPLKVLNDAQKKIDSFN